MTAPNPTPATLDAAVEAAIAARDTGEHGYLVSRGYLDEDDVRGLIEAAWPILAADHADQLAQAHAAGTTEGAKAERERIAQERAQRSGMSKSERNRQRRNAIRSGQLAPSSHGASGYSDGCRCVVCRNAHTMASKRRRMEVGLGMRQVASHGRTGFDAGCRCQVCASGKARSR